MFGALKDLAGIARALTGDGKNKGLLGSITGALEKLPALVEQIPSAAQVEAIKTRAADLERLSRGEAAGDAASLSALLSPLLAHAFDQTAAPAPPEGYSLEELFTPTAADVGSLWPVYGSALAMAIVQTLRELNGETSPESAMDWGAFQKEAVLDGQWWRVFTHAFVHTDRTQALTNITATVGFGTAIARLGSPALAFSMFRLGIFVGLLSEMFERPGNAAVSSVSGSSFCMLGALVTTALLNRQQIKAPAGDDIPAGMVIFMTGFNLLGTALKDRGELSRAQVLSTLAGAGAAGLAHIIARFDRTKAR